MSHLDDVTYSRRICYNSNKFHLRPVNLLLERNNTLRDVFVISKYLVLNRAIVVKRTRTSI